MARIKYNPLLYPIQGKHYGFTFIRNRYGQTMMPGQRNKRTRYTRQAQRMQNIQKAIRNWRNMDAATQANWETFAASYPQPSKRNPAVKLSGYQLFLKRNHYCFLNHGIESNFMMAPALTSLPPANPVFYLQTGINQVDITDLYISNFGKIPTVGQLVQFMAIPYAESSGQFFPVIHSNLEILATYLDGFFLSIEMPVNVPGIVYSVYLSKPLNPGYIYPGSKVRYMGCFTTKSFLGLSDTPNSYAGQAGKVPVVNVAENALEWGAGGVGGLTCETLAACPSIISINSNVNTLLNSVANLSNDVFCPKLGFIYNGYTASDSRNIASPGWHVPSLAEYFALSAFLGGDSISGQKMKENSTAYWNPLHNTGTNVVGFNLRGGNYRDRNGSWTGNPPFDFIQLYTSTLYSPTRNYYIQVNASGNALLNAYNLNTNGGYLRLIADSGTPAFYVGNDGKKYQTIVINGVSWLAANLAETRWRDGSFIDGFNNNVYTVFSPSVWELKTVSSMCVYSDNLNYL